MTDSLIILYHSEPIVDGSVAFKESNGTFTYSVEVLADGYMTIDLQTSQGDQMSADLDVSGIRTIKNTIAGSAFGLKHKNPITIKMPNRYSPGGFVNGVATSSAVVCVRS